MNIYEFAATKIFKTEQPTKEQVKQAKVVMISGAYGCGKTQALSTEILYQYIQLETGRLK